MTQCLRSSRTRRSSIVAIMAIACAVSLAIVPVVAALPVPKELDPVTMITIPAGEFLMGNPEGKGRDRKSVV